jgi:single-strand DNA-binding protein
MSGETNLTISGNLTANPKSGKSRAGDSWAKLRIASSSRVFDRAESRWRDGETVFLDVTCWRRLADNVIATLERGDAVLVTGRLRQRSYDDAQGARRTVTAIEADAVGPDLSRGAARLLRLSAAPAADSREREEEPPVQEAERGPGIAA